MTDADDVWNLNKGIASPSQAAGVDAHYYAGVVDDFYGDVFNRNSLDDQGLKIVSKVHYDRRYCNAFWNGAVHDLRRRRRHAPACRSPAVSTWTATR